MYLCINIKHICVYNFFNKVSQSATNKIDKCKKYTHKYNTSFELIEKVTSDYLSYFV